MHLIKEKNRIR